MRALIIIDVQNDFCPGGSLAVPDGDEVVPVINSIMGKFNFIVATRDWHPENHVSFAGTHGKNPGELITVPEGEQMLWPAHCIGTTDGSEFHKELHTRRIRMIIHKGMNPGLDSYSAFYENDGKTPTGLSPYLNGLGINEIFLCGLATDYCVYFSAMDSMKEGFKTNLILDGCRGVNIPEGRVEETLSRMKNSGVKIINSSEL